jgi:hypothetical protein
MSDAPLPELGAVAAAEESDIAEISERIGIVRNLSGGARGAELYYSLSRNIMGR